MRPFLKTDHQMMCDWFKARGQMAPPLEFLPECGLVVSGVAMGFLIKTDCKFGILDFFITNKDTTKRERAIALDEIATELIRDAHLAGLHFVKCDTRFENIKDLAIKLKFSYLGESSSFVKEL